MYEEQKKQAEQELTEERLKEIKEKIKSRIKDKQQCEDKQKRLNREIIDLVNEGKLENLNDYIKIDPLSGTLSGISITM